MKAKSILSTVVQKGGGVYIAFFGLSIILSIVTPSFLSVNNLTNVLRQAVYVSNIVFGSVFVMSMGGIDLSVGSTVALSGLVAGELMQKGLNIYLAILLGVIMGAFVGLINGLLIDRVQIAPFIATMATMTIVRGAVNIYTKGIPVSGLGYREFQVFGQGYLGFIPVPVIISLVLFAASYYLFNWTKFGRHTLSIGSNEEAARLVGIKIHATRISVYVLNGIMCGISGILLTSRMESAMPTAGEGYEMDVIAAAVIGGTSLSGGRASMVGAAIGAILMAVVRNGLNLLSINTFWHQVVMGIIILIAVSLDRLQTSMAKRVQ